jgi:WD40 repeat protein
MILKGHSEPVLCHQFDEYKLVSGGEDSMIRWWDIRKGQQVMVRHQETIIPPPKFLSHHRAFVCLI